MRSGTTSRTSCRPPVAEHAVHDADRRSTSRSTPPRPSDAGGGTEVTGGRYGRVQVGPSTTAWTATQGGTVGASSGTGGRVRTPRISRFRRPRRTGASSRISGCIDAVSGRESPDLGPARGQQDGQQWRCGAEVFGGRVDGDVRVTAAEGVGRTWRITPPSRIRRRRTVPIATDDVGSGVQIQRLKAGLGRGRRRRSIPPPPIRFPVTVISSSVGSTVGTENGTIASGHTSVAEVMAMPYTFTGDAGHTRAGAIPWSDVRPG